MKTILTSSLLWLFVSSVALAQKVYSIPWTDPTYGYSAEFPTPRPIQLYKVEFKHETLENGRFVGWKSGLPVYGGDSFAVTCLDIENGPLRGKNDLEMFREVLSTVNGIDTFMPEQIKLGKQGWEGFEIVVQFKDTKERYRCARYGGKYYMLCAVCADSQPNPNVPDPFTSDFVYSATVVNFFDSFELTKN